jgi:hypothetical protein
MWVTTPRSRGLSLDTFLLLAFLLIVTLTVTLQIPVLFGAHFVLICQAPAELGFPLSYSRNGHDSPIGGFRKLAEVLYEP